MVVDTISDFLVSNNYTKKFIAIDYGLKHIGMAISDPSNIISVPYGTFTETLLSVSYTHLTLPTICSV